MTGFAIDRAGDVIVVGELPQPGNAHTDLAALKLDGADGDEIWRVGIDGTRHVDDFAEGVALDSGGNAGV